MTSAGPPVGQATRGTTGYNRLRRSDRWLVHSPRVRVALLAAADPLVIDLGAGAAGDHPGAGRAAPPRSARRAGDLAWRSTRRACLARELVLIPRRLPSRRLRISRSHTGFGAGLQRAQVVHDVGEVIHFYRKT